MSSYYIHGIGKALPSRAVSNADLETYMDTTDEWIQSRTGIRQRYMTQDESNAELSAKATMLALEESGFDASAITHIIGATCSPDSYSPSLAASVSAILGIPYVSAFDMNAMCSGYVYGLEVARGFLAATPNATVLLLASELMSRRINMNDRTTAVLFGDAATATILSTKTNVPHVATIEDVFTSSDGRLGECLTIGGGCSVAKAEGDIITSDFFLQMNGREVFKNAVRIMPSACEKLLEKNGLTICDIDLLISHQANYRIIEAVGERLGIPPEKVFINVHSYGNTSAASIPLALCDAREQKKLTQGMKVLVVTFGGGFTWGASILQF